VPWLQEGCQNRLAGSVSTDEFVARSARGDYTTQSSALEDGYMVARNMLATYKGESSSTNSSMDTLPANRF